MEDRRCKVARRAQYYQVRYSTFEHSWLKARVFLMAFLCRSASACMVCVPSPFSLNSFVCGSFFSLVPIQ